jgi:hypothetical protein
MDVGDISYRLGRVFTNFLRSIYSPRCKNLLHVLELLKAHLCSRPPSMERVEKVEREVDEAAWVAWAWGILPFLDKASG